MERNYSTNKRIAKNTILLYIRTFFVMLISLYTSRVVLQALGVEDYGIYSVVGGLVAMFSMISNALTSSISRYIAFEIGHGDKEKLRRIFSTSVYIQIGLSFVVILAVEIVGVWFLETHMQIPSNRMNAAYWVLQCSLATFCINLISIPYSACLIAHEHMKQFAYVSIFEAILRLGMCFLILKFPSDRLISYAVMMAFLALLIRFIYGWYCHCHFEETKGKSVFDKDLFREMSGFSGWSFFTNTNYLLNTQGINMLMNVYYGVTVNAARGIATQVESAVMQFVNNFTTAINPQITKSYAAGDLSQTQDLVCRGAKFSYFAMLLFAIPIIFETETILTIWLTKVPEYAVIFTQLSLVLGAVDCIGATSVTACFASGHIKKYALILTPLGAMEFPLTWIFFACNASVVWTYYLYILVKIVVIITRFILLNEFIGLKMSTICYRVIRPIVMTTIIAILPSFFVVYFIPNTPIRLVVSILVGIMAATTSSFFIGMTKGERIIILSKVSTIGIRFKKNDNLKYE